MTTVHQLTFNPFSENTYIIVDQATATCAIVDPGCMDSDEENDLLNEINRLGVKPTICLNTHCHIDHILGNWICIQQVWFSTIHPPT